jgi:hypothetical protein
VVQQPEWAQRRKLWLSHWASLVQAGPWPGFSQVPPLALLPPPLLPPPPEAAPGTISLTLAQPLRPA